MSDFISGLHQLAGVAPILCIAVGLIIGFLVGLIPGFGAPNATAILLPFTLTMSLLNGLLLMVGIYAGVSYSMAIPAIVLNIPTEPGAAVTALDGYPMAQQGKAAEAIGVARLASVTGGIIGIGGAILLLRPLASQTLKFGPGELFLLSVIGMVIIGSMVSETPLKGLLSGTTGFLIAGLGVNPATGLSRFDFGQIALYDGMPFIPVVIGLFGVTEMCFLARRAWARSQAQGDGAGGSNLSNFTRRNLGGISTGLKITAHHPGAVIRSGVIGLLLGLIPGLGQAVANFISYGFGRSRSKSPETWGKGNPEGIIASEGCDNGVTGGAMIPILALGIPGSATTAVMLSALALHGVAPGPQVLSMHGSLAYAVLIGLFLANLLILPLGVILALPMVYLSQMRYAILIPIVLFIAMVGAYSYRLQPYDLKLVIVFGVLGILMRAGGYPLVPLLIGIVLGPEMEQNLLLALEIGRNNISYFYSSVIDKVLLGLLLLLVLALVRARVRRRPGSGILPRGRGITTGAGGSALGRDIGDDDGSDGDEDGSDGEADDKPKSPRAEELN